MDIKRQERAPIYEALEEFKKKRVVPFDEMCIRDSLMTLLERALFVVLH